MAKGIYLVAPEYFTDRFSTSKLSRRVDEAILELVKKADVDRVVIRWVKSQEVGVSIDRVVSELCRTGELPTEPNRHKYPLSDCDLYGMSKPLYTGNSLTHAEILAEERINLNPKERPDVVLVYDQNPLAACTYKDGDRTMFNGWKYRLEIDKKSVLLTVIGIKPEHSMD